MSFFLTLQEMTIFKFSFLVAINAFLYLIMDAQLVLTPKFTTLLLFSFLFLVGIQILAVFLNVTTLWTRNCSRIPLGILFMLLFVCFVAVNVYL